MPSTQSRRVRVTRACDACHRRGRKCIPSPNTPHICLTCSTQSLQCTWDRIPARRGAKPRFSLGKNTPWMILESRHGSPAVLEGLVDVFFEDVYPIVCSIHEPSFRTQSASHIQSQTPIPRGHYARLLAICALSSQRIVAGASSSPEFTNPDPAVSLSPSVYFDDALAAVSGSHQDLHDLESLQAVHLLCVTAMETGNTYLYHRLMGLYHTIVADQGLADERRWPLGISAIEREERRRLLWHMYRLEVHTALILGHVIRSPERQIAIDYPSDGAGIGEEAEWMTGWNFVTDLYRGLEHLLVHFRSRKLPGVDDHQRTDLGFDELSMEGKGRLLDALKDKYNNLPRRFKESADMSCDIGRNRCVYQTANIICTYQLLKMLSCASGNISFQDACDTVLALVDGISAIPVDFIRRMSLAMVQELSGFGHLLGSFIGKDLLVADYEHLKMVMVCMAELLECLAPSIPAAEEAARRVRKYVAKIDDVQVLSSTVPARENIASRNEVFSAMEVAFPPDFLEQMSWYGIQAMDQQAHHDAWL